MRGDVIDRAHYDAAVYDIVSIGGIATDIIVRSHDLPSPGACVTASDLYRGLGGKAANQAVAAARLGGRVALIGCLGADDGGRSAMLQLAEERVATEYVVQHPGIGTGAVMLIRNSVDEKQVVVFPGANAQLLPHAIDAAQSLLNAAAVVLVQLEIPLGTVQRVVELVRGTETRLILDPSPVRANLPHELVSAASVVKVNAGEASALTGIRVRGLESARAAAARLREMGAQLVAIEAGRDGNLFASRSEEVFLPLYEVPAIDPTGAGDTLAGAFAVAMVEGQSLRGAATFACGAAALAARRLGAQNAMPSREELDGWLAAH